jgi:hypothetical protein
MVIRSSRRIGSIFVDILEDEPLLKNLAGLGGDNRLLGRLSGNCAEEHVGNRCSRVESSDKFKRHSARDV